MDMGTLLFDARLGFLPRLAISLGSCANAGSIPAKCAKARMLAARGADIHLAWVAHEVFPAQVRCLLLHSPASAAVVLVILTWRVPKAPNPPDHLVHWNP